MKIEDFEVGKFIAFYDYEDFWICYVCEVRETEIILTDIYSREGRELYERDNYNVSHISNWELVHITNELPEELMI